MGIAPFEQYQMGIGNSCGNARRELEAFQQCLQISGYTLGNAQIKEETLWVHFQPGLQPIRNKEYPLAYRLPCSHTFQAFSVYFLRVRRFY